MLAVGSVQRILTHLNPNNNMNNTLKYIIIGVVGVIVGVIASLFFVLQTSAPVGGSTNYGGDLVVDAFTANTSLTSTGDTTVSGGTLRVTTANTATSTLVVGCVQFYATSTATALKYQASTTPGIMYSQYGTCPNL